MINSKCIFVGNIPYDYDEKSLNDTLSIVGPVKHFNIKNDETTKKSKGYGFCEYTDAEVAASALRNLKNIDYNGRQLRINIQEHDKSSMVLTEDMFKASKEISYIKGNDNSEVNFSSTLKNLTDEQKLIIIYSIKTLSQSTKLHKIFLSLLENQNENILNSIIELQNSFIDKYNKVKVLNKP